MAADRSKYQLSANLALGVVCLILVGLIVSSLLKKTEEADTEVPSFTQNTEQPQWQWFSAGPEMSVTTEAEEENFSESYEEINIRGELVGVVIAEGYASATILTGREQEVFEVGEEIEPGVELIGVERRRILVRRNGQTLQLSLPEPELGARMVTGAPVTVTQEMMPASGQPLIAMPNVLMATPVQTTTHNGGLLLSDINPDLAGMVDIRKDDVIVEIGGNDVQSLQSNPVLYLNLANETSLPVTLIRDGEEKVIYVNARSLSNRWMPGMRQE